LEFTNIIFLNINKLFVTGCQGRDTLLWKLVEDGKRQKNAQILVTTDPEHIENYKKACKNLAIN